MEISGFSSKVVIGAFTAADHDREAPVNVLAQLVERGLRHPDLVKTASYRRRFQRLVRQALASPSSTRAEVMDLVDRAIDARPSPAAEGLRELLSVSLMPAFGPPVGEELEGLLSRLSGTATARAAGMILLSHLRDRFGPEVRGQFTVAMPNPVVVAAQPDDGPIGDGAFTVHWTDGERDLGSLTLAGLDAEAREELAELVPWLQPLVGRLVETERIRASEREAVRESREWKIKASLLALTQTPQSSDAYLRQAVSTVRDLFASEQASYWRYDADADRLTLAVRVPAEASAATVPDGPFREAVANRQPRLAASKDESGHMRFWLVGPVFQEEMLEGVLLVSVPGPSPAAEEDLTTMAAYVAAGLKTVRFFEQLSFHASHDPLTGLANRRTLGQFLDREFRLARRHGAPLSLLMIDLDHFKPYNDTYGHPAGDALLKRLSEALQEVVRCTDFVARYGGEEFAVVLPHTDREGARSVANKVIEAVRALHVADPSLKRPVTASVGLATYPGDVAELEGLIEAADQAMYRAKNEGRDRIAAFGE